MKFIWIIVALGVSWFSPSAYAELKDENLLQGLPDGYVVGYEKRQGKQLIVEMVPKGETVEDWTEMLTTNIYFGGLGLTAEQFQVGISAQWKSNICPGSESKVLKNGVENGYPVSVWYLYCPNSRLSQKPEWTWFKAIQGNDSFYVVQKAWSREPDDDDINRWIDYLGSVKLCDSRVADRQCPSGQ